MTAELVLWAWSYAVEAGFEISPAGIYEGTGLVPGMFQGHFGDISPIFHRSLVTAWPFPAEVDTHARSSRRNKATMCGKNTSTSRGMH